MLKTAVLENLSSLIQKVDMKELSSFGQKYDALIRSLPTCGRDSCEDHMQPVSAGVEVVAVEIGDVVHFKFNSLFQTDTGHMPDQNDPIWSRQVAHLPPSNRSSEISLRFAESADSDHADLVKIHKGTRGTIDRLGTAQDRGTGWVRLKFETQQTLDCPGDGSHDTPVVLPQEYEWIPYSWLTDDNVIVEKVQEPEPQKPMIHMTERELALISKNVMCVLHGKESCLQGELVEIYVQEVTYPKYVVDSRAYCFVVVDTESLLHTQSAPCFRTR